jgi:hypothetical protein
MKKLIERLEKAKRIQIEDYRDWVPGKDSNGGCYSYHYKFEAVPNGFRVRYCSSAEFEYCEKYGNYQSCHKCMYLNGFDCNAPDEIWSREKLLQFILDNEDEEFEVYIDGAY